MKYNFTDKNFDKKLLTNNEKSGINRFLLENNSKQTGLIYDFLENDESLLLVNGFLGTGKSLIVEHVLSFLSEDSIVLNYNCFETTILDDILLAFFEEFRKLIALEKITVPKIKTENFTQKINAYFMSIEKPIIVLLDGFDAILKSNKPEILGFIEYISSLQNVKVILKARAFDFSDFSCKYGRVTVLALDKGVFEKYLRAEDCKQIGPLSDELYKHTRGYFLYTTLSLKIMKLRNLTLIDFLDGFAKSFLSFNDFILREVLSLVDPVSGHLIRFLTVMRHPVSVKLLKKLRLYDEDKVLFFINNNLLSRYGEYIYLPDYYKTIAENSISEGVALKLHQGCVELYNTQLPLKPLERDLVISRQTMRNEIEYHSVFLPRRSMVQQELQVSEPVQQILPENKNSNTVVEQESNDEKIKKMSFIFDDDETGVLDKIADSIKNFMISSDNRIAEEKEENTFTLTELMNKAKQKEQQFDFKHAISLYQKALVHKDDDDYHMYLPTIYCKLADANQNISNWYEAQKYYELAEAFYRNAGDLERAYENKYKVANVLFMTFKREKASEILNEIVDKVISDELKIKVLVLLANLTSNFNKVYAYYKEAIGLNALNADKVTLSELYYKFALENENCDNEELALEFYKKCIALDMKENPYLSDSLSNIALIYDDNGRTDLAVKYYLESLKIDEAAKNIGGSYSSLMHLAEIYASTDLEKALAYYNKALEYAHLLKEDFYIISTNLAIGDFYFNRRNNKLAYSHYKDALCRAQKANQTENIQKIQLRIDDIKLRIGEERFVELEK